MKTCFKCGVSKERSEFYKHPQMGDGLLGKCKECSRKDVTANRALKVEYYREFDRSRANLPKRVEARAQYAQTPNGREAFRRSGRKYSKLHPESGKRWQENNPRKRAAHILFGNFIRYRQELKQPCSVCGTKDRVHAHHEDYNKPLDVVWYCPLHHSARHREMRVLGIVP